MTIRHVALKFRFRVDNLFFVPNKLEWHVIRTYLVIRYFLLDQNTMTISA